METKSQLHEIAFEMEGKMGELEKQNDLLSSELSQVDI